jgi:hypothetical protein
MQSLQPRPDDILADPAASEWLKSALQTAVARDPIDALNDALILAATLEDRLRDVLGLSGSL